MDRCKPGDRALVIGGVAGKNIGNIVVVLFDNEPAGIRPPQLVKLGTFWRVRSTGVPIKIVGRDDNMEANCFDAWLLPLDNEPPKGIDELESKDEPREAHT